jgi:hypothetical protein
MDKITEVKITSDKLKAGFNRVLGVSECLEELDEIPEANKFPGFAIAKALLEKVSAEIKAKNSFLILQDAVKGGVDINEAKQIKIAFKDDEPFIVVEYE